LSDHALLAGGVELLLDGCLELLGHETRTRGSR
jgi:hypothetical protein